MISAGAAISYIPEKLIYSIATKCYKHPYILKILYFAGENKLLLGKLKYFKKKLMFIYAVDIREGGLIPFCFLNGYKYVIASDSEAIYLHSFLTEKRHPPATPFAKGGD